MAEETSFQSSSASNETSFKEERLLLEAEHKQISEERKELLKDKATIESQRKLLDSLQREMDLKRAALLEEEQAIMKLREEGESARISLGNLGKERTAFALKM